MKDILIVEDGPDERERLERIFSEAGYAVSACDSVGAAERVLQLETFRLAVLDIGLNDKSGSFLFNTVKRGGRIGAIIIFTGNPSVHLKQRFLDEGAVDYIVKGSPYAQSELFLNRVREVIGAPNSGGTDGMDLEEFLRRFVPEASRQLFLESDNALPECRGCRGRAYRVTFSRQAQVPPEVIGTVVCAACGRVLDPEVS